MRLVIADDSVLLREGLELILTEADHEVVAAVGDLLATGYEGVGYLLKDRVADIPQFLSRLDEVTAGGSALDPEVVAGLLAGRRREEPIGRLTPRERAVLGLVAEGRSNASMAAELVVTEGAVEKHTQRIFAKLDLSPDDPRHRRVTAVLTHLRAT